MDANFGFLARHLLLTELHGEPADIPGGIEVRTGGGTWLGLWDSAVLGEVEPFVVSAQQRAAAAGGKLAGAVLLAPLGESGAWDELAEALFVYGLPEASGPDSVMVLTSPPHPRPRGLRFLPLGESPGAFEMAGGACASASELTGPAWPDAQATCELLDVQVAWHDTEPVGAVGSYSTELALRVALLWIEEQWRERELAQALVEHVAQQAHSSGKLLICTWARKSGLLRFALHEAAFEEQVAARFFKT